jgi:hypothetical protein
MRIMKYLSYCNLHVIKAPTFGHRNLGLDVATLSMYGSNKRYRPQYEQCEQYDTCMLRSDRHWVNEKDFMSTFQMLDTDRHDPAVVSSINRHSGSDHFLLPH